MAPVRDWARQVSQFAVCDDYAERYESPVIDFRPLRELAAAHETYAEWLASEGRTDEAVHLLCDWIGFGRRLSAGGRSLVSMMFGVFIERRALTALSLIEQRGPLPDSAWTEARHALGQPVADWANLQRVFLNEMAMFAGIIQSLRDQRAQVAAELGG
jgi:hypothetical protein